VIVEPKAMYRSVEWPWMMANVDGFIVDDSLTMGLEIKTGTSYQVRNWGGVDGDEIPDRYYAQVQHYMAVLGLDGFYVFGVIGNQRLLRVVPRNESFIKRLVKVEADFWDRVMSDDIAQAPAPIGADVDLETVLALGDPRQDEVADLWGVSPLIAEHGTNRDEIKRLEHRQKELSALIAQAMGNNKRGEAPTGKVTIVDFEKSQFDQKRLKTERPEIVAEYQKSIRVTYPRITTTEES
jgi:predicted phage-related endonuclease